MCQSRQNRIMVFGVTKKGGATKDIYGHIRTTILAQKILDIFLKSPVLGLKGDVPKLAKPYHGFWGG